MPQPYSEDLRWQVIWMIEFLRYSIDEVAAALLSPKTILFYVSKFLNSGEVKAETLGQLLNSFLMHPHVEFVIMQAVLDHLEKPSQKLHRISMNRQGQNMLFRAYCYFWNNHFGRERVCQIFLVSATFWFFPAYVNLRKNVFDYYYYGYNHSF